MKTPMMNMLKAGIFFLLLAVVWFGSGSELWQHVADQNWVADYVAAKGLSGITQLALFGILFTGCGGPRQLIALTYGFTFGAAGGMTLALLCGLSSAVFVYAVARFLFTTSLVKHLGQRYQTFRRFVRTQPFTKVLTLRLLPIGSNLLTNLLSGLAGVPVNVFVGATFLGYLPQTFIFSLAGAGIGGASRWQLTLSLLLWALSLLLTHRLYRRHRQSSSASGQSSEQECKL